jgi:transposase
MTQYKRIGIDTSKAVFTLHGIDQQERPVLRINLRRAQMISFFKKLPPTVIALEACGGSHYWARELTALGHTVRLIPPQYVKPYVKRGKNDRHLGDQSRHAAGQQADDGLVAGAAATQTSQARRRGARQQDSPHGVGDDEERRGVSAPDHRGGGDMTGLVLCAAQTSRNAMEWNHAPPIDR